MGDRRLASTDRRQDSAKRIQVDRWIDTLRDLSDDDLRAYQNREHGKLASVMEIAIERIAWMRSAGTHSGPPELGPTPPQSSSCCVDAIDAAINRLNICAEILADMIACESLCGENREKKGDLDLLAKIEMFSLTQAVASFGDQITQETLQTITYSASFLADYLRTRLGLPLAQSSSNSQPAQDELRETDGGEE